MRTRIAAVALSLVVGAGTAAAQTIPFDVELGYRFLDITGNTDMYRTQIDERAGVLLHSFTFSTADLPAGMRFIDNVRIDAADLGAGPAGSLRLEAGRAEMYRLKIGYTRRNAFSALPAFANPLFDQGVIPGQHTYDRVRTTLDVDLELFPGKMLTPILGYSRNRYDGPGRTTYTVGQDEFRLDQDLADTDQEVRAGLAFKSGWFSAQVVQGWRAVTEKETLKLAQGAGGGNSSGTVLDRSVFLTTFSRTTTTDNNTPVTWVTLAAEPVTRLRITGSYMRANAEGDTSEGESLAGSLVAFPPLSRFFGSLTDSISSRAKNTQWRGSGRIEWGPIDGVDFTLGYVRRHRELEGFALFDTLFFDTTTFTGVDPRNLEEIIKANTSLQRTEKIWDVGASAKVFGPIGLRVGWSQNDQALTVTEDPSEIVVPVVPGGQGQGGNFARRIRALEGGATFNMAGVSLGADARREQADVPILRTDFVDRNRYRARASWAFQSFFRIGGTWQRTELSNDRPGIGYDSKVIQWLGDVDVSPWKPLHVRFSGGKYEANSSIPIRQPVDFSVIPSVNAENGRSVEGGLTFALAPFSLDGSVGRFRNTGSFPFTLDRARVRAEYAFTANVSLAGEWARDDYDEGASNVGGFLANRFGVYVRVHP